MIVRWLKIGLEGRATLLGIGAVGVCVGIAQGSLDLPLWTLAGGFPIYLFIGRNRTRPEGLG